MKSPPLENETCRAIRHMATDAPIRDVEGNVHARVPGVEVRWSMLSIIHRDDDSEETRDYRHSQFSFVRRLLLRRKLVLRESCFPVSAIRVSRVVREVDLVVFFTAAADGREMEKAIRHHRHVRAELIDEPRVELAIAKVIGRFDDDSDIRQMVEKRAQLSTNITRIRSESVV